MAPFVCITVILTLILTFILLIIIIIIIIIIIVIISLDMHQQKHNIRLLVISLGFPIVLQAVKCIPGGPCLGIVAILLLTAPPRVCSLHM